MHQGKNAAGQRGDGQQLNHARQRETNRQGNQQLDVAAANPSSLVNDQQQQQQDRSGDQRLGNLHRAGQLTSDPEERQRQTNFISDQSCRVATYSNNTISKNEAVGAIQFMKSRPQKKRGHLNKLRVGSH